MIEVSNLRLADWDSPLESPWCVSYEARTDFGTFPEVELVSLDEDGKLALGNSFMNRVFSGADYFRDHGLTPSTAAREVYEKLNSKLQRRDFRVQVNEVTLSKAPSWKKLIGPSYLKTGKIRRGKKDFISLTALSGIAGGAEDIRTGGSTFFRAETGGGLLMIRELTKMNPVFLDNLTQGRAKTSNVYIFRSPEALEKSNFFNAGYYGVFRNPTVFSQNGEPDGHEEPVISLKGDCHVFADSGTFLLVMKRTYLQRGRPRGSGDRNFRTAGRGS